MNYREALAWLYATQRFGIKLGLENIERLLRSLDLVESRPPRDRAPVTRQNHKTAASRISALCLRSAATVIHVAGTNGKGSVCALIDAVCCAAGYRVGLFTSPHLVTFRERIRVNGEMISEDDVAHELSEIRERIGDWDPHPTFFEIVTALALKHFRRSQCEVVILETGMGGRLDATNAVQSSVSIITPIDLDHEKWLGHSIAEIAREKAGIIKPATPVISAPQPPDAESVIKQHADASGASLQFVNETWTKSKVALPGEHQKMNAAVAMAAVQAANISITDDAVAHGFESVEWPARFQIWNDKIVIDGAHNPAGAKILAQSWREVFGDDRAIIILATLRDKNVHGIIQALVPMAQKILLPRIRSERAMAPNDLAEVIGIMAPSLPHSITPTVADSIDAANQGTDRILITGSLHFAGEALAFLRGEPNALEECAQ
ncbi:MAG TPA: folylpolyglutamate synthase/dihydrofolate synthase family protein [Chthoniobacterales bacterium]|nr:folylpolyglutamate synthase/dihydrofolate synthase family protein [Chthoniobacterales bacterium]